MVSTRWRSALRGVAALVAAVTVSVIAAPPAHAQYGRGWHGPDGYYGRGPWRQDRWGYGRGGGPGFYGPGYGYHRGWRGPRFLPPPVYGPPVYVAPPVYGPPVYGPPPPVFVDPPAVQFFWP